MWGRPRGRGECCRRWCVAGYGSRSPCSALLAAHAGMPVADAPGPASSLCTLHKAAQPGYYVQHRAHVSCAAAAAACCCHSSCSSPRAHCSRPFVTCWQDRGGVSPTGRLALTPRGARHPHWWAAGAAACWATRLHRHPLHHPAATTAPLSTQQPALEPQAAQTHQPGARTSHHPAAAAPAAAARARQPATAALLVVVAAGVGRARLGRRAGPLTLAALRAMQQLLPLLLLTVQLLLLPRMGSRPLVAVRLVAAVAVAQV